MPSPRRGLRLCQVRAVRAATLSNDPLLKDCAERTPASDDYPIATFMDEVVHLRMQSDLYRDDTHHMLTHIDVRPGWGCLDLCAEADIQPTVEALMAHLPKP